MYCQFALIFLFRKQNFYENICMIMQYILKNIMQKYFRSVLRSSIELSKKRERLLGSKKCMVVQQKISRGPRLFFPSLGVPRLLVWILLSLHGASKTRKPSLCLKSYKYLLGRLQSCSKGSSRIWPVI